MQSVELNAQKIYGYSDGNLISFDLQAPQTVTTIGAISGLPADTELLGMDFRPNTGELFALSANKSSGSSFLVKLNLLNGAASTLGTGFMLEYGEGSTGFDFNPTVDRIRVVTSHGYNYRLNPISGGLQVQDGDLSYASSDVNSSVLPRVVSCAYTNSYIGSTSTTLYNYDAGINVLVSQIPPNDGVLNTIGSSNLSFDSTAIIDMDILAGPPGMPNTAIMVATADRFGSSQLYSIDLTSGATALLGNVGLPTAIEMISFQIERNVPPTVNGELVYALNSNGILLSFDSENPEIIRSSTPLSGLAAGQALVGVDFRPNTGELWGLGYNRSDGSSRLYIVNPSTGVATAQGSGTFNLDLGTNRSISFDFNPAVDRIRVIGANGNNYRLNPLNGSLAATDGQIKYATGDANEGKIPSVVAAAYTNSYLASSSTSLYAYDAFSNVLALQNPPNDGILNTIGGSGLNADPSSATFDMDIYYDAENQSNTAYFTAEQGGSSDKLYTINLQNGQLTELGFIGNGIAISKITVFIDRSFPPNITGRLIYGITQNNYLFNFDSERPETIRELKLLTGIEAGQMLAGADFRPNTGELWVLGYNTTTSKARLYTADLSTGALATAGMAEIDLDLGDGSGIGFDFNPTVDRIRVVSSAGKNYRLNPITGGLAANDGNLKYATGDINENETPTITSAAYSNSYIGSTSTGLFVFDAAKGNIAFQNPPNDGTLNTVGSAGLNINPGMLHTSMDAYQNPSTGANTFLLAAKPAGSTFDELYNVNTSSGAITRIGRIGPALSVRALSAFIDRSVPAEFEGPLAYGLTSNNNLVTFDTENPEIIRAVKGTAGIKAGERIVGIDFRPATSRLFALGYNATAQTASIYTIDTLSGALTIVGAGDISMNLGNGIVGFDFNPVVDRLRVVSQNGNNYRIHPETGVLVATDGVLAYASGDTNNGATPNIVTGAYSQSFNTTTATTLYNIDASLNILVTQVPPNDGILNTIGGLGVNSNPADPSIGLDIYYDLTEKLDFGYVVLNPGSSNFDRLFTIDLADGSLAETGRVGQGIALIDIAIAIDSVFNSSTREFTDNSIPVSIMPNPGNEFFTILYDELTAGHIEVTVFDLNGKLMLDSGLLISDIKGQSTISTHELPAGMYIVKVKNAQQRIRTSKWIKTE
ncbi:MAG: DUF4394 domain-containing protein [Saprospiraceae bacterium]|nr:DUF4394 domain-containing protein [Saprospiraceae bacterium]